MWLARLRWGSRRIRRRTPGNQGEALDALAEVLEAAGRRDEAVAAWQGALDLYELKPIIPLARFVHQRLSAIKETGI